MSACSSAYKFSFLYKDSTLKSSFLNNNNNDNKLDYVALLLTKLQSGENDAMMQVHAQAHLEQGPLML